MTMGTGCAAGVAGGNGEVDCSVVAFADGSGSEFEADTMGAMQIGSRAGAAAAWGAECAAGVAGGFGDEESGADVLTLQAGCVVVVVVDVVVLAGGTAEEGEDLAVIFFTFRGAFCFTAARNSSSVMLYKSYDSSRCALIRYSVDQIPRASLLSLEIFQRSLTSCVLGGAADDPVHQILMQLRRTCVSFRHGLKLRKKQWIFKHGPGVPLLLLRLALNCFVLFHNIYCCFAGSHLVRVCYGIHTVWELFVLLCPVEIVSQSLVSKLLDKQPDFPFCES